MTKQKHFTYAFFFVVMFFFILELILRQVHCVEKAKPFELIIFTGKSYYTEDLKTIWRMKGGAKFTHKNHEICLNSHGFREREFDSCKSGFRVLCLGGSTTFGWGVSTEETFSKILESKLNECYGERSFEVINAGIPGFTSIQGLKLVESNFELFNPDWIVFSFTYNDQTKREQSLVDIYKYLDSNIFKIRKLLFSFQIAGLVDVMSKKLSIPVSLGSPQETSPSVPLDDYKTALVKMIQLCSEKEVRLIFLSEVAHPENKGIDDRYKKALLQIAREHNVAFLDAESIFKAAPLNILTKPLKTGFSVDSKPGKQMVLLSNSENKTIFPESIRLRLLDSCHYTASGHFLIAEKLFESVNRSYGNCN